MHLAHAATKPRPGAVLTVADLHRRCVSLASQVLPEAEMTERQTKPGKRWIAKVKTDSTHPPPGLFTQSATTIARTLASKRVSPKGPGSGMRMLIYFINRSGGGLSAERRAELEKAKSLLSQRVRREKEKRNRRRSA